MKQFCIIFLAFFLGSCGSLENDNAGLFVGNWLEETPNRHFVQGISLKADGTAASIGMATLKYEKWKLNGNKLILSGQSLGNGQTIDFSEKWQIIEINPHIMKIEKSNGHKINYRSLRNR